MKFVSGKHEGSRGYVVGKANGYYQVQVIGQGGEQVALIKGRAKDFRATNFAAQGRRVYTYGRWCKRAPYWLMPQSKVTYVVPC